MKKHLPAFVKAAAFVLLLLPSFAFSQEQYVFDNANKLSGTAKNALEARLGAIKSAYKFNLAIITEEDENIWHDLAGFYNDAFGFNAPGALLYWDVNSGWYIDTYGAGPMGGKAILNRDALTEAGQEYLVSFLDSDPYRAYTAFIDDVEKSLKRAYEKVYVNDGPHLLTEEQVRTLEARIAAIKSAYDFDVVLVTEESIHGEEPMVYADDFFDYRGGGFGHESGGVLLLWVTDIRWAWFSGYGLGQFGGETLFNDFTISVCDKHIDKHLKGDEGGIDDTYGMYMGFLDDVEKFLTIAAKGGTYNLLYETMPFFLLIVWIAAFLIAAIVVNLWKAKMNTARKSGEAAAYIVKDSLRFTHKTDIFLYSTTTSTVRVRSSSSSGGHSRSGSHRSSSGRSHSGGGGRH